LAFNQNRFMNTSVYSINKSINKSIEFKGYKAQYIWYLGAGLIFLLIFFAVIYIAGVHPFICLAMVIILGAVLFIYVGRLSNKYGEQGLMKKMANKALPEVLRSRSRLVFQKHYLLKTKF